MDVGYSVYVLDESFALGSESILLIIFEVNWELDVENWDSVVGRKFASLA